MNIDSRVAVLGASLALGGCQCDEERPYTPFRVTSASIASTPPPPSTSASAPGDAAPAAFEATPTLVATSRQSRRWHLGDQVLEAPDGLAFERAIRADLDDDGTPDLVVWAAPDAQTQGGSGSLWVHRGGKLERVATTPAFVPTGPDCTLEAKLAHTGPHTVTLDTRAECAAPLIARSPTRAVTVVAPLEGAPLVATFRLADPAPGERLEISTRTTDRDDDGRDDVELTLMLTPPGASEGISARFLWLDRAAGLARDPRFPAKDFQDAGSVQVVRAKGTNTSHRVPSLVEAARRLFATACAEGGVPRLFDVEGAPLTCGDLDRAFAWYSEAELVAALTRGAPLEAVGVLLRADWYGGEASPATKKHLASLLKTALPEITVTRTTLGVRARERGSAPRWSPLRFEPDGSLAVMTVQGVVRVRGDDEPEPADEEIDPWPLSVQDEQGIRLTGAAFPCDRNELTLLVSTLDGRPLPSIPVPLLAARPSGCSGDARAVAPMPDPIAWEVDRHEARVMATVVRPTSEGAPVAGGAVAAVPTPIGLVVGTGREASRWVVQHPEELHDCVVNAAASAVACVRGAADVVRITRR